MTSREAQQYRLIQAMRLIDEFVRDHPELNLAETSPGAWEAIVPDKDGSK